MFLQYNSREKGVKMETMGVELFSAGCLGTCWYGNYSYLEPWVGCEHDCDYCYARYRSPVQNSLQALSADFAQPVPLFPPANLLEKIRERLRFGDIRILKLSRYTDVFSPIFVKSGLSHEIFRILTESSVERIIVTTKGKPDEKTITLMEQNKGKFSYNIVAKPISRACLEKNVFPIEERLGIAAKLFQAGIQTTVHMDPIIPGLDDSPEEMTRFLDHLAELGLKRVMFSLLLLSDPIVDNLKKRLSEPVLKNILSQYEIGRDRQFLPKQEETNYFDTVTEIKKELVEKIARLLKEKGFSFVLCSIKNLGKNLRIDPNLTPICDGTFYA